MSEPNTQDENVPTTVTLTRWHWLMLAALIGVPSGGVTLTNWQSAEKMNEAVVSIDKRMIVIEENQKYLGKVQDSISDTVKVLSANQTTLVRVEQNIEEFRRQNDEIRRRLDKVENTK
jgi:predicted  nucleic acid-binding Zn-ribbon protein